MGLPVRTVFLCALISACVAQQAYQRTALDKHNEHRAKHHSPSLQLDNSLNDRAVKCARYYANKGTIDHSCQDANGVGENLAGGNGNWGDQQFAEISVKMWYDEVKDYDYDKPGFSMKTGHFTQVVWKNSQRLGFGYAQVNGYTASVALYSPPGNYEGQYRENVLKP